MAAILTRINRQGKRRYTAVVRLAGHPTVSATFGRLTDARTWAARVETEIRDRRYPGVARVRTTLGEAMETYMEAVSARKKPSTQERERRCAKRLLEGFGAGTQLRDLTPPVVARYRDRRLERVSAYTVRMELALLSHLFRVARQEWGLAVDNPVVEIRRPGIPRGRTRFLTEVEAARLLAACRESRNRRLYAYVLALIHTGMRPSEAAGLRCGQVDLDRRMVHLGETKTGEPRRVPLTRAVSAELEPLVEGRGAADLVFLDRIRDRRVPSRGFRAAWVTARRRAGLADVRLHDLRHTAASHLLMSGCDLRTLADILGHRTMQMVQRYTHLLDGHKREVVDRIGGLGLGGGPAGRGGARQAESNGQA